MDPSQMSADEGRGRQQARLTRLRSLVERTGSLRLGDAAQALGVSSMTLRRDLAGATSGLDLLGGHIVTRQGARPAYSLSAESDSHASAKRLAGTRAAALVEAGDTIFVDCGTTMPYLVAALASDPALPPGLTVVCYALNIAAAASRLPGVQMFMLGGVFHASSATFFSEEAIRGLARIGITKAFLSAGGLHETQGATCSNFNEVPVKRVVLERALRSFLVIDGSKLGRVKPAKFADADAFDRIITDLD